MRRAAVRVAAVAAAATLVGCATSAGIERHLASTSAALRNCALWYRALDGEIDAAGVRDAQAPGVPGFPYLRVDRLHAALRPVAVRGEPALGAWTARLAALDLAARKAEIENMPGASFDALPDARGSARTRALERTRECAGRLREADLADPIALERMIEGAQVPDDYSDAMRILGLYAFTRLPFASGVQDWQDQTLADFRRGPALPEGAALLRYAPPGSEDPDFAATERILARAATAPLGIPELSESEFEQLSSAYAPSFAIEVSGDYDRFGALRWTPGAELPGVDPAEPTVYRQAAYTRYEGKILLQLVYTIWFSERPEQGRFDILAGKLDGLVWRVTLAPDGEPLVYDAIHPCGCYHMFFPTARAQPTAAPDSLEEWAFVPQTLARLRSGERPLVRIAARTHAIAGVSLVRGRDSPARYAFRPYDELRSLARPEGGARSAFGPEGLISGSERTERFLFWPMGIASAGAMRQWGRHPTAFVGRRHFDDADLFERRFVFSFGGTVR